MEGAAEAIEQAYIQGETLKAAAIALYHGMRDTTSLFILARAARQYDNDKIALYVITQLAQREIQDGDVEVLVEIAGTCTVACKLLDVISRSSTTLISAVAREKHGLSLSEEQKQLVVAYRRREFDQLRRAASQKELRRISAADELAKLQTKRSSIEFESACNRILNKYECEFEFLADAFTACAIYVGFSLLLTNDGIRVDKWMQGSNTHLLRHKELKQIILIADNWDELKGNPDLTSLQKLLLARTFELSGVKLTWEAPLLRELEVIASRFSQIGPIRNEIRPYGRLV